MKADKIKEVGIRNLALQLFAVFAILALGERVADPLRLETGNRIVVFALATIVMAAGLLGSRKWAVMYLCLCSVLVASWMFFESIWFVPFPFNLCTMFLAVVFVLPINDFIRSWSLLSWGGKWFF